jgi:hypothetical protein
MPASETPTNPKFSAPEESGSSSPSAVEEVAPPEVSDSPEPAAENDSPRVFRSSSRYLDYDTHELLERINQYEDERRWQRIREGIWISIILHILFFSALTWIPKYIFHAPAVIDPFDAIKQRKDLTYLDELPDAIKQVQKIKPKLPPLKPKDTVIDKKTLDALKAQEQQRKAPPPPPPAVAQNVTPPEPKTEPPPQPAPVPPSVAAPQPNPQIALEPQRPSPVPARPSFALPSQNPADRLRDAMRDSARNHGQGDSGVQGGQLNQHPGAAGGAQILSDTQGVDFDPWLRKVVEETQRTWDPLVPEEVNAPLYKRGEVEIVFTVLPNGRLQPNSMILAGRSGDVAMDRAAWGSITGSDYPPLPREFHGPYIQLRFRFMYNVR